MLTLQRIANQLATIASVDDAKEVRDKAEALRVYSRQQRDCREIERQAVVIRLRAERRIGELLASTVRAGNPNCSPGEQLPAGITRKQSSAWQLAAKLPEKQFEKYLEGRGQLSTKGVVRLAHEHKRQRFAARGPASGGNVLTGDMWQLHNHLDDDSVDLFLTDPPYTDAEHYKRLAELAAAKLKPGGLCLAYSGQFLLPEIMQRMGEHLTFWWMYAVKMDGCGLKVVYARRVQQAWKPVLAFAKGKPNHRIALDCLSSGKREKQLHPWQKNESEISYFIEKLTEPGELVVDPFCGSGTTLAAAKELNRRFLGCEIDAATARGARRRVA